MSRWTRAYDLYQESHPTPQGDSGLQISRGGSGGDPPALGDTRRDRATDRRPGLSVERPSERQDLPLRDFAHLVSTGRPQLLTHAGEAYRLTGDQVRALATVGAFRAVPVEDITDRLLTQADLTHLRNLGLLHVRNVSLQGKPRAIATISKDAQRLLEAHRAPDTDADKPRQALHAGFVKPAELAHDSHLYALYEVAAADLQSHGATIERVQVDYELKREYQAFLHRSDRPSGTTIEEDREAWADAHGLAIVDGELHLPDLRIEYTDALGHSHTHDVELVTVHYSSRSVAAKRSAGFALYRHGNLPHPNLFERLT